MALVGDRPRGRVHELAGAADPHRERDLLLVAERGVDRQAVRRRGHLLDRVLLLHHVRAALGAEVDGPAVHGDLAAAAHAHRDGANDVATDPHDHHVRVVVDRRDAGRADGEGARHVLLAVDAVADFIET